MEEQQTVRSEEDTVLVVEDEVFVRMIISDYLRQCGYRVIEAASADEALTILKHTEIKVDIVFSDIEMPGTLDHDQRFFRSDRPHRLDFSAEDDKERNRSVANLDQHFAARGLATLSAGRDPRDLLRSQRRKRRVRTGVDNR